MSPTARKVLYVALIIAGFGTTAFVLVRRNPEQLAVNAEQYTLYGVCLSCREEGELRVPRDEDAPHTCGKCQQKAVYPWWFCYDCNRRFVPALFEREPGGPPRVPPAVACTGCQSQNVTPYLPQAQLEPPVGDVPLPPWPQ